MTTKDETILYQLDNDGHTRTALDTLGRLKRVNTFDGTVYVISGDFDSVTDMIDALQDSRPVKIQQIGADTQNVRANQDQEIEAMVRRIARTGALTWGSHHLEDPYVWTDENKQRISDDDIDAWLEEEEDNPSRNQAFQLARLLLGIDDYEGQEPYLEETTVERVWNPDFPQNAICDCGHPYHRHFDSYDYDNYPAGCKYCPCNEWRKP